MIFAQIKIVLYNLHEFKLLIQILHQYNNFLRTLNLISFKRKADFLTIKQKQMKLNSQINHSKTSFSQKTEQLIRYESDLTLVNGRETDTQFIQDIKKLHQLICTSTKFISQNKESFSQEQLEQVNRKCLIHAQATKFSSNSSIAFEKLKQQDKCLCGCNKGRGEEMSILSSEQSFTFLGQGVLLYFLFQKKVIILIIVCALIYGIYNVVSNLLLQQFVQSPLCQKSTGFLRSYCRFRYQLSVQNKDHEGVQFFVQVWLGFLITLIWTFGLRIIRVLGTKKGRAVNQKLQSSASHCIFIDNLPFGGFNQKQIQQFLLQIWERMQKKQVPAQLSIKSIQIIYKMEETRAMIHKLDRKIKQIGELIIDQNSKYKQLEQTFTNKSKAKQIKFYIKNNQVQDISLNQQKTPSLKMNLRYKTKQPKARPDSGMISEGKDRGYNLGKMLPPIHQKKMIQEEQHPYQRIKRDKLRQYISTKQSIIELYEQLKTYRWMFMHNSQFRKKLATSNCIVHFCDIKQKNLILAEYGTQRLTPMKKVKRAIKGCFFKDDQNLTFKDQHPKISKAPQPSDIQWSNCQKKHQIQKNIKVWGILILIIALSFGMLVLVRFIRTRWAVLNNVTLFAAFSLQVFNRIIAVTVAYIIKFEQNNTKTASILSVMTKSSLAQAVNVIFLPLLLNSYLYNDFSGPNGLVGVVVDYQVLVCFTMMLWNLIDIPYMVHKFSLWATFIRNKIIVSKTKSNNDKINQYDKIRKVLEYYQPPELPIAGGYVYMITIINQAFFFCHLQPMLLLLLIFNMGVFLLINKYLLYKRCKLPALTDFLVFQTFTSIAKKVPLMYGFGSLFFICYTDGNFLQMLPSLLCITVSILDMLNPNKIFTKITTFFIDSFYQFQELGINEQESSNNLLKQPSIQQDTSYKQKSQIKNTIPHLQQKCKLNKTSSFFRLNEVSKDTSSLNSLNQKCVPQGSNMSKKSQDSQMVDYNPLQYDTKIHEQDKWAQDSRINQSIKQNQQQNRFQSIQPMITLSLKNKAQEKFNLNDFLKVFFTKTISILQQSTRKQSYSKNCNINQLLYFETYFMTTNTAYPSKKSQQFFESFGFKGQSKINITQILG